MKKGINYWAFSADPSGSPLHPIAAMQFAKDLGYDCFELTFEQQGAISPVTKRQDAENLRNKAEAIGIKLYTLASGLAWGTSPTHPDPAVRERAVQNSLKMIEMASWLGVETILYLPGMVSAVFVHDFTPQRYDHVDQLAKESLQLIVPTAEKLGVKIGVENVWNRYLLSPVEMRDFIDSFNSKVVGAYFDVANVMLYGHPEHWISILGNRIFAVHLKDFRVNVGNLDGFVDLLSGDVDYPAVMSALQSIGYKGPFTAEIVPGKTGCIEKALTAMKLIEKMN
jgi:L-ribulose-5-phosphate 3-epimerase